MAPSRPSCRRWAHPARGSAPRSSAVTGRPADRPRRLPMAPGGAASPSVMRPLGGGGEPGGGRSAEVTRIGWRRSPRGGRTLIPGDGARDAVPGDVQGVPPRQKAASFTVGQVGEKLEAAITSHRRAPAGRGRQEQAVTVSGRAPDPAAPVMPPADGMVWIPGATFIMGSDRHYPEEAPAHPVTVSGFWIDPG